MTKRIRSLCGAAFACAALALVHPALADDTNSTGTPTDAASTVSPAPTAAPERPLLLLYAALPNDDDTIRSLGSVRTELRARSYFDVITYNPDAPAVKRAAMESNHPEWVDKPITTDDIRIALAKAVGATYFAIINRPGRDHHADIRMVAVTDPDHTWTERDDPAPAAADLENDASAFTAGTTKQDSTAPAVTQAPTAPQDNSEHQASSSTAPSAPTPAVQQTSSEPTGTAPALTAAPAKNQPATAAPAGAPERPAPEPVKVAQAPPDAAPDQHPSATASDAEPSTSTTNNGSSITEEPVQSDAAAKPSDTGGASETAPTNDTTGDGAEASEGGGMAPSIMPPSAATRPAPSVSAPAPPPQPVVTGGESTDTQSAVPSTNAQPAPPSPSVEVAPPTASQAATVEPSSPSTSQQPPDSQPAETSEPISPAVTADDMAEQLRQARPLMVSGDAALGRDEIAEAISDYRDAINAAPLSAEPRLKLAQAYLKGGFPDKAIDEAKRALLVSPDSVSVQEFLIHLDSEDSTSAGTVALYQALVEKNPADASAHIGLGDADWNNNDLPSAEQEYKTAEHLLPPGDSRAEMELARLYAIQSKYDDAYASLEKVSIDERYPLFVKIVEMRSDTLMNSLSSGREAFDAAKSSHEEFYDLAKRTSTEAGALADFIDRISPPAAFKVSHLHRKLAVDLIGQEADVLQTFIETSNSDMEDQAAKFEKDAETEMLTAHAAEEKQGLLDSVVKVQTPD